MEDIRAFETFFSYEPTFNEDPMDILTDILRKAKKYLKEEDLAEITKTYHFAKDAHA